MNEKVKNIKEAKKEPETLIEKKERELTEQHRQKLVEREQILSELKNREDEILRIQGGLIALRELKDTKPEPEIAE